MYNRLDLGDKPTYKYSDRKKLKDKKLAISTQTKHKEIILADKIPFPIKFWSFQRYASEFVHPGFLQLSHPILPLSDLDLLIDQVNAIMKPYWNQGNILILGPLLPILLLVIGMLPICFSGKN